MSSFKNNFECEATLMSTKQYYCLHGRNKNKIWSRVKLGGGGLQLICLAEKVQICVQISTASTR